VGEPDAGVIKKDKDSKKSGSTSENDGENKA